MYLLVLFFVLFVCKLCGYCINAQYEITEFILHKIMHDLLAAEGELVSKLTIGHHGEIILDSR